MLDTGGDLLLGATSFSGFGASDKRFLINGSSNARFEFGVGGNQIGGLYADADKVVLYTSNNDYLSFQTIGNEKLKIDNSAIYVKSGFPLAFLASSGPTPNIKSGGTNNQDLVFTTGSGNPTRLQIDANGNVVIGHTVSNAKLHIASGTSNAVGDGTNPALQIGSTANFRFGMYTDSETAFLYNKNGDNGFNFLTKTTSGGNATKFKIHRDEVYGVDDFALTGTGNQGYTNQAHPLGVIEWQNNTDNGVNRYNCYIQATGGDETDMYITIRNGSFYRITVKASHNSTQGDVAMFLIYGMNSRSASNRITEVKSSGSFTCADHNTHVNSHDSTVKISYSSACNQGLRALVETIGGF